MALAPHEVTAVVTVGVTAMTVAANLVVTWVSLRHARTRAHNDRLWLRKAETYEAFMNYLVLKEKSRHEFMTAPKKRRFRVYPEDPEEMYPAFNRMMIYASPAISAAVTKADEAETAWREAYARWHSTRRHTVACREAERKARMKWEIANATSTFVITLIEKELLSGRRLKIRWIRSLRYEQGSTEYYGHVPKEDDSQTAG